MLRDDPSEPQRAVESPRGAERTRGGGTNNEGGGDKADTPLE